MRDRPVYIAFMCWFLIFYNAWSLYHAITMVHSPYIQQQMALAPLPLRVLEVKYYLGFAVPIFCGIFMAEGANWARMIYFFWGIACYLVEVVVVWDKGTVLVSWGIFGFCGILLMLPRARGYFHLPRHYS